MRRPSYVYVNEPLTAVVGGEGVGVTISARVCESDAGHLPTAIGSLALTSTTMDGSDYVVTFPSASLRSELAAFAGRRVFLHVTSSTGQWYEVWPLTVAVTDPELLPPLLS